MDTMDVNAEVLDNIFNQEEVPVIILKEFEIITYFKVPHVCRDIRIP